jgi:alkaline phosphatase D
LLQAAGAAAATGLVVRPAWAEPDPAFAPFLHGVASGDPLADGVLLWTRVTQSSKAPVMVAWRVATDVGMKHIVANGHATTNADRDYTVKVNVRGLRPAAWYFYDFAFDGRHSIIGRTKTAPRGAVDHLRFGVASCANYTGGFFNAYALMAQRNDLDAVIHLGDYIYDYGNGPDRYGPEGGAHLSSKRDHDPPVEMVTLEHYRRRHGWYKLDPDLRRLHQLFPFVATWDDHESADNSWRGGAVNHGNDNYGPEGPWEARKGASRRAYSEWMPVRMADPARVWRRIRYGDLADLIVMDTRLERDEQVGMLGALIVSGTEIDDPARIMISPAQRTFVFDALADKAARWKVVCQQVILGQFDAGGLPKVSDEPDTPAFVVRDGGNAVNPDQWDGYTAERERLFKQIRDKNVRNVVVLTGDVHSSWALDLTEDPFNPLKYNPITGSGALGVEYVSPSITAASLASSFEEIVGVPGTGAAIEAAVPIANPHVKYFDGFRHGYFTLDLTAGHAQADWWYVDTIFRPSKNESGGPSWTVQSGAAHLVEASGPAAAGRQAPASPPASPSPAPTEPLPPTLSAAAAAKRLQRQVHLQ